MRHYSNIISGGRRAVELAFDDLEAARLGPAGTRLALEPVDGADPLTPTYVLRPDERSRTRLHRAKKDGHWQATFYPDNLEAWPTTGMTVLKHSEAPNGFYLYPRALDLRPPRSPKRPRRYCKPRTQDRQELPLDLPAPYYTERTKKLVNRAVVGALATVDDLRAALELLNDVLARLPADLEVELNFTELSELVNDRRVRRAGALVTTRIEL